MHDLQVGFQLICYQSESCGSSVNEKLRAGHRAEISQIVCNSYEDPNVDDCGKIACVDGSKID